MQDIIEDVVRWFGLGILWVITLGRYRGGGHSDRLPEGAFGLAIIIGATDAVFAVVR